MAFSTYIRNVFKEHKDGRVSNIASAAVEQLNESCGQFLRDIGKRSEQLISEKKVLTIGSDVIRQAARGSMPNGEMASRLITIADELFETNKGIIVPLRRCRTGAQFSDTVKVRRDSERMLAALITAYITIVIEDAIAAVSGKKKLTPDVLSVGKKPAEPEAMAE